MRPVTSGDTLIRLAYRARLSTERRVKALERGTPRIWEALATFHDWEVAHRFWNAVSARAVLQTKPENRPVLVPCTTDSADARLASCSLRAAGEKRTIFYH